MSLIAVVECETAADVMRLARERAQRRRMEDIARRPVVTKPEPERRTIAGALVKSASEMIRDVVKGILAIKYSKKSPSVAIIQQEVAKAFGIEIEDLLSQRRDKKSTDPRQVAMLLCRIMTGESMPAIGRRFGGRDHTTVLHAIRKYKWMEEDLRAELKLGHDALTIWAARAAELHKEGAPCLTPE
jgi:chromosomal replication initiation ATPase DnaA